MSAYAIASHVDDERALGEGEIFRSTIACASDGCGATGKMISGDTTQRKLESVNGLVRPTAWIRWAFPVEIEGIELEHGAVIGRASDATISIAGNGVSRRHAEICRQGPIFTLKDLGSTNGTFVNGKRVVHAAVVPGSVLRIGDCVGVFSESTERPVVPRLITENVFGGSELQAALAAAMRAAASKLSIVSIGSTGTGKERVARALHSLSGRRGPFQAINCAALPAGLAEAELFGYRKGAFTGAERASLGHFRAADGGTLFLDEITDLPLSVQAKLLRVLEQQTVTPLGETDAIPIDVRIIAAAHRPLEQAVSARVFRDDLLARLAGLTVTLPSLRARCGDIPGLFLRFAELYGEGRAPAVDARLIEGLCLLDWPGNVRELEQFAHRALVLNGAEATLKPSLLPEKLQTWLALPDQAKAGRSSLLTERREHDRQRLAEALRETGGRVSVAAARIGFSRQRAYRLLGGSSAGEFIAEQQTANLATVEDERS